jgi:hypothetical protein
MRRRQQGSTGKVHIVVDTLGQLLYVHVTLANELELAGQRTDLSGSAGDRLDD